MAHSVLRFSRLASVQTRLWSAHQQTTSRGFYNKAKIGNRDVVGFGINGQYNYVDHLAFPMQAIRFKENTADVLALRAKEKGDWKKLTLEEKKALYRASFCQTYAEMLAPTGIWKPLLSGTLVITAIALWVYVWLKKYVYPPLPSSFTPERKAEQLQRMIDLRINPIDGIASKWDYEKGRWKE